jgi:acyl-CoA synthetase (AMP-forming)/AMP-acid ligase II
VDTIPALLRAAAAAHGNHPAYVEDGRTTSFGDLLERVRRTAGAYASWGLSPGDRVGIWAPNSVDWVVAALAVSYAGATLVPLNSRYTAHEVASILRRVDAPLAIVADGFLGKTQIADLESFGTRARIVDIADLADVAPSVDQVDEADGRADAVTGDDIADILFTSGTTGEPKGVLTAHRQTVGVARVWGQLGGVTSDDRYLVVNPFFHSFGYKVGIVTGLVTGATLYPMATFDPDVLMGLIQSEGISVLPGAPTIFSSMLASPQRSSYDLSSLRLAVTGAAVVPVVLIERMRSELGIEQVVTAFGMTEAVVATMCRGDEPADVVASTCGRAVDGMETRIADDGELLLRGDYVMLGYLDDPEATAEAIDPDGWLHTGDVGELDAAGNLRITDRKKDMYISGGFNVYPAEIEKELARLDGVVEAAVVGIPDERLGEVGRAYVVRSGEAPTAEEVVAFCKERLANFKVPREVVFVDGLPRNLSGKVLKNELRIGG